jgi:uncharacterized protein (PEP-CTERM system associated)
MGRMRDWIDNPAVPFQQSWCHAVGTLVLALGCCFIGALPTEAADTDQPFAPTAAPAVRVGNLATQLEQFTGAQSAPVQGWSFSPSIGLQELATDNVLDTPNGRRADLITEITPGILVNGNTPRLQATLNYAPTVQLYAFTAHQNNIDQEFDGQAVATVIPDLFYVRAQGFSTQQAISGGVSPNGQTIVSAQNRADVTSFAVTPYLQRKFTDIGTGQIGYSYQFTSQSGNTAFAPSSNTPFFESGNLSTNEEFGKFTTGNNFGRLNDEVLLDASQNTGFGLLQNSYQNLFTDDAGYAITRSITILGEVGYEQIAYPHGYPPIKINDPVWYAGARLTPNPDSVIVARYGHRYGYNAAFFDGAYALTAHTKLFGNYSDTLTTDQQQLQGRLASVTLDQFGNPVDTLTGAPVLLANQFFGLQDSLFRLQQLTVGVTTTLGRDTISLAMFQQNQKLISTSFGVAGYSQRGTSGSVSWSHQLSPAASTTAYLQYGTLTSPILGGAAAAAQVFTADLSYIYRFSDTLTGNLQYILSNSISNVPGTVGTVQVPIGALQNVVLVGVTKHF